MSYIFIKSLHIGSVTLSLGFFVLRGIWMLTAPEHLQKRWVRVLPHIIDSMLLGSAILLTIKIQQYPFVHAWLTAKILALLAYIVLGTIAIKRGRTRNVRLAAWIGALAIFAYILSVATTHQPAPWR